MPIASDLLYRAFDDGIRAALLKLDIASAANSHGYSGRLRSVFTSGYMSIQKGDN
jgi:hypothetical protein